MHGADRYQDLWQQQGHATLKVQPRTSSIVFPALADLQAWQVLTGAAPLPVLPTRSLASRRASSLASLPAAVHADMEGHCLIAHRPLQGARVSAAPQQLAHAESCTSVQVRRRLGRELRARGRPDVLFHIFRCAAGHTVAAAAHLLHTLLHMAALLSSENCNRLACARPSRPAAAHGLHRLAPHSPALDGGGGDTVRGWQQCRLHLPGHLLPGGCAAAGPAPAARRAASHRAGPDCSLWRAGRGQPAAGQPAGRRRPQCQPGNAAGPAALARPGAPCGHHPGQLACAADGRHGCQARPCSGPCTQAPWTK